MSSNPPHEEPVAPPGLTKGASIGRYTVLGLVGRGAMGEVYAAYDPELDRKVALKLLLAEGGSGVDIHDAKARLLREAQAIARLSHPNVIVVHDVGSFGRRVFIAMEFVDGFTVWYWLLSARRTWQEVLSVYIEAGRGLAAAHAAQLVHRDFKPENVMVGRDGQVRVMDFGLARHVAEGVALPDAVKTDVASARAASHANVTRSTGDLAETRAVPSAQAVAVGDAMSVEVGAAAAAGDGYWDVPGAAARGHRALRGELTQSGTMMGSPAYMASERFRGEAANAKSDQFSFCVALYEGLYGERPFAGETLEELAANVLAGTVRAAPASIKVPARLRRVILRGLRPSPEERWPSMETLLAALARAPRARWRWSTVAGVVAAAAVALGLFVRAVPARRPMCQVDAGRFANVWESVATPGSRREAIARGFGASGKSYARDAFGGVARLLDRYVATWSSMYVEACQATNIRGEQSAEALDLRMTCLKERWTELRALSDVLVSDQSSVANAGAAAASLTPVERCAELSVLRAKVAAPTDPRVAERVAVLRDRLVGAKALQDAGRFSRSLEEAIDTATQARALAYRPLLAEALRRVGLVQIELGQAAAAEANLEEALWLAQACGHDELVADICSSLIFVSGYLQHDGARARIWKSGAEAFLERLGGHDLLHAWMLNNVGVTLDAEGKSEDAAVEFMKALRIKERVLGKDHPDVGYTLANLADTLAGLGRPREALEHSNRGVEIIRQVFGWQHPKMAEQLGNRALILNQLGRYEEARRDAQGVITIEEDEMGPFYAKLVYGLGPLGEAELGLGSPGKAADTLERAISIADGVGMSAELVSLKFALARALWESGRDRKRALALARATAVGSGPSGGEDQRIAQVRRRAVAWLDAR